MICMLTIIILWAYWKFKALLTIFSTHHFTQLALSIIDLANCRVCPRLALNFDFQMPCTLKLWKRVTICFHTQTNTLRCSRWRTDRFWRHWRRRYSGVNWSTPCSCGGPWTTSRAEAPGGPWERELSSVRPSCLSWRRASWAPGRWWRNWRILQGTPRPPTGRERGRGLPSTATGLPPYHSTSSSQ